MELFIDMSHSVFNMFSIMPENDYVTFTPVSTRTSYILVHDLDISDASRPL